MPVGSKARTSSVAPTACGLVAVAFAVAVPAHALPGSTVQVPLPEVEVPSLPLPAPVPQVPVPQVPVPQVPAPQLPAPQPPPAPSVPQLPSGSPGGLPSPSGGAPQIPGAPTPNRPSTWAPSLSRTGASGTGASGTGAAATGEPGTARSNGGSPTAGRRKGRASQAERRRKQGIAGTRFKTPRKLVRGLRGCIDEIPRVQRVVLVLRHGVGSLDARSRRGTARTLGTSPRWVAGVERRGMRSLARTSRSSGCEGSGVRRSVLADVVELIVAGFVRDAFGTTAGLFAPGVLTFGGDGGFATATTGADDGVTKVRGVRESGAVTNDRNAGVPEAPALPSTFGDLDSSSGSWPSLLLLAAVIFGAVFVMRRFSRALR